MLSAISKQRWNATTQRSHRFGQPDDLTGMKRQKIQVARLRIECEVTVG